MSINPRVEIQTETREKNLEKLRKRNRSYARETKGDIRFVDFVNHQINENEKAKIIEEIDYMDDYEKEMEAQAELAKITEGMTPEEYIAFMEEEVIPDELDCQFGQHDDSEFIDQEY